MALISEIYVTEITTRLETRLYLWPFRRTHVVPIKHERLARLWVISHVERVCQVKSEVIDERHGLSSYSGHRFIEIQLSHDSLLDKENGDCAASSPAVA
jgi:hypothetical protein